ncbi:NAD-dependent epimerase/dehydratase family protein [Georgenia alba]|uniref:NAD-dependent epimerase/dehydratase family protein n=1 Tax=Georgenia alba TaxID=2233858 RepID=A0ABW2QA54_9MICO
MPDARVVGITGAGGYVGTVLTRHFRQAGWHVVALQRSAPADPAVEHRPYDLTSAPGPALFEGLDALVHCAYDLRLIDEAEIRRVNLLGTERLFEAARTAGVGSLVLISSMSAYEGTTQIYGRTKLACEHLTTQLGGTSLRLGLVYGDGGGGMAGALTTLATLPVAPVLRPEPYQYTVHEDDMARCVLSVTAQRPVTTRMAGVANGRRVPFDEVLRGLRRSATGSASMRVAPVPGRLLGTALRLAERSGLRLPFRADSLDGLVRPAPAVPNIDLWTQRRITLRDYADHMLGAAPEA